MPIELPPGIAAQRDDRNPPPTGRQLWTIAAVWVGILAAIIWMIGAIGNQLVLWIPPRIEQQLGAVMAAQFADQVDRTAPEFIALNQLLQSLESHLPTEQREQHDYEVWYLPDDTVNALALPGDRIIIYEGLLKTMTSENELAMVLGHELGHFAHRDHLRGLGRALVWQLALGSIGGNLGSLQQLGLAGLQQLNQAQFSQRQETQADEFGLTLLQTTYGHVGGATDFFSRLADQSGPRAIAFLASHPVPQARVRHLHRWIEQQDYRMQPPQPLPPTLQRSPVEVERRFEGS